MRSAERRKVNVFETKCSKSLVGVSRMDRLKNEEVCTKAGIERECVEWNRIVEWGRMDEYRMARRVLMTEVREGRVRGRPRLGWMDGVML